MQIGLRLPQTGRNQATKENIVYLAKQAENAGFRSLWVLERLLWPINPQNPYPGTRDGKFPDDWQYIFDPLETLIFVAANTSKITLGTSVVDMLFHNPVILARRFVTLDVVSEGRAIAGLGIGWSKDEYQVSDIPFRNRGKRADEYIQILKRIWTEDIVEFKGQFYNIPASKIGPKPLQKPYIPIYLGGYSQKTFARIANYDIKGWLGGVGGPLEQLESPIKTIKNNAKNANKDPNNFKTILLTFPNLADSKSQTPIEESQRYPLTGTIDQIGNDIKRIKDMGIDHIILSLNFQPVGKDIDSAIEITKQLSKF